MTKFKLSNSAYKTLPMIPSLNLPFQSLHDFRTYGISSPYSYLYSTLRPSAPPFILGGVGGLPPWVPTYPMASLTVSYLYLPLIPQEN